MIQIAQIAIQTMIPSLYVDPGSGALLWQAVCALVVGAAFSFRNMFRRPKKAERNEGPNDGMSV